MRLWNDLVSHHFVCVCPPCFGETINSLQISPQGVCYVITYMRLIPVHRYIAVTPNVSEGGHLTIFIILVIV